MRRRDLLAGALALGAAGPAFARPVMLLHETPRHLLSPPFVDGEGRELTLADFRGRVVLLNVWATWCVSCREEMPTLDRLQDKGYVSSVFSDPTPERGGRSKRYFTVRPLGLEALRASHAALAAMWEGLEPLVLRGA